MTAVILLGGQGSRLRPVLGELPKALAPLDGRPFLDHQLSHLAAQGVSDVVLATGHGADEGRRHCRGGSWPELHLELSHEEEALGTAGALRQARELIGSDPFLVLNGDSLLSVAVPDLTAFHRRRSAAATVALTEVPDRSRFGAVEIDSEDRVAGFLEKGEPGPGWISGGLYLLSARLLQSIPPGREVSLEKEVFPNWIGWGLFGFRFAAAYVDIVTPESYAIAQELK